MSEASSAGPGAPRVSSTATNNLYPVFQKGAGRGGAAATSSGSGPARGRGRGASSSQAASDSRWGALNALSLELQAEGYGGLSHDDPAFAEADEGSDGGGPSDNEDFGGGEGGGLQEDDERESRDGTSHRGDASPARSDGDGYEDDEDRGGAALRRAQGGRQRKRLREDDFDGAAMGAGSRRRTGGKQPSESGSVSGRSMSESAQQRETAKRVFPVAGLRCLCCSLAHRLGAVDTFVDDNCTKLEETALFKFAALVFTEKIAAPIEAEGVPVPKPTWEQMRCHYLHHVAHPKLQRAGVVKQLSMMRAKVSERLVRYDDTDPTGRGEIDKNSADLLLKVLAQESKERELLFAPAKGAMGRRAPGNSATPDD